MRELLAKRLPCVQTGHRALGLLKRWCHSLNVGGWGVVAGVVGGCGGGRGDVVGSGGVCACVWRGGWGGGR